MSERIAMAFGPVLRPVALGLLALCLASTVHADEHMAMESDGDPLGEAHYVIKVTPTLAYLDIGTDGGAMVGQPYTVLREQDGLYVVVAETQVLRVFDSFSIAEILSTTIGEQIDVLHRAVHTDTWREHADMLDAGSMATGKKRSPDSGVSRTRSVVFLGGLDLGKDVDLLSAGGRITGANSVDGGAVALRLSKTVARNWRLALTYRLSGEPLSVDADVTQLSVELDTHLLLRGAGRAGPYVGVGFGMHQLAWDTANNLDDTTYKMGFNAMGGLDIPLAGGAWGLLLEGGYQKVMDWDGTIDASGVRAFGGLSINF